MPSIWDLLPASAWPVQPFVWPFDPTQPPPRTPTVSPQPSASPAPAFGWAPAPAAAASAPSFGWASASPAPPNAPAYSGATDPDALLGAFPHAELDPAYTARLAEDARRAYEFARWAFGPPSRPAGQTRAPASGPDEASRFAPPAAAADAVDEPPRSGAISRIDDPGNGPASADVPVPANWADQWDAPIGNGHGAPMEAAGAAQPPEPEAATGNPNLERQGERARRAASRWGINSPGEPLLPNRVANRIGENFRNVFEAPLGPGPEYRAAVRPFIVSPSGRINVFNRAFLVEAPELADAAVRGLGALYDSAADTVTEGLVSLGLRRSDSERIGRDLKALPEAFPGSPGSIRRMVPPPPLRLTGQVHHGIPKRVFGALENHYNLRGIYEYRDPRFETQAVDLPAHNGWWGWHQELDDEVANHILRHPELTQETFESYLHRRYAEPDLRARFPNGFRRR
jgi:hypothetical protein